MTEESKKREQKEVKREGRTGKEEDKKKTRKGNKEEGRTMRRHHNKVQRGKRCWDVKNVA